MEKIGLVLEGGALRGLFTAGVLDFFMEKGIEFPYVVGVSAGTCNGLDFVSKQIGRSKAAMIQNDFTYYYGFKELKDSRKIINLDTVFEEYPYNQYPFDFQTYFNSETVCEMTVTNCINGQAEFLTEKNDEKRLLAIAKASSSMPVMTKMVRIDGTPYLDGGCSISVPIDRAIEMGCTKLVVVLTRQEGSTVKQLAAEKKIYEQAYKDYPEFLATLLNRPKEYQKEMERINQLEKEGMIYVIRPLMPNLSRLEQDPVKLNSCYEHGFMQAREHYAKLMEFLNK